MKKIVLLTIVLLVIGTIITRAEEVKVTCKIRFNGAYKPDTVYIGLFPTMIDNFMSATPLPAPVYFTAATKTKVTFDAKPGVYMLGCCAWKYCHAYKPIFIPPGIKRADFDIVMEPAIIGWSPETPEIKEVYLRGDFNKFSDKNMASLEKAGDIWKLNQVPPELKKGQKYVFVVNREYCEDLLNDDYYLDKQWLSIGNVYNGNEIIFDPSLYSKTRKQSQIEAKYNSVLNEQLIPLITDLRNLSIGLNKRMAKPGSKNSIELIDSVLVDLAEIENKYDKGFRQRFVEEEISFLDLKIIFNMMAIDKKSINEISDAILKNEQLMITIQQFLGLLKELDAKSCFVDGSFVNHSKLLLVLATELPDVTDQLKIPNDFFIITLDNFQKNTGNLRIRCEILVQLITVYCGLEDRTKTMYYVDILKGIDSYEKYITPLQIERLISQLIVGIGKPAPDFEITLLDGKNFKLSDHKGKFVFIDFWGSWCQPCLAELPNIKRLYSSVPGGHLQIIGLAQDEEAALKKCIEEKQIEYPNALATPEILAKFNISRYPTSFVINPKGLVVRADVRGEDAMNLLIDEIKDYFR